MCSIISDFSGQSQLFPVSGNYPSKYSEREGARGEGGLEKAKEQGLVERGLVERGGADGEDWPPGSGGRGRTDPDAV